MAQVFTPRSGLYVGLVLAFLLVLATLAVLAFRQMVDTRLTLGMPVEQPIPFSHKHHVVDDGIDCRYCHTAVERSAFAGIPPTETCMTCHSQLFTDQPMIQPIVDSYNNHTPLQWDRVHDLPDFVYFNHSVHVDNGIGCVSCHGRVDRMPLVWQAEPLTMQWCLACHRDPRPHLRPADKVFDMSWTPPPDEQERRRLADQLMQTFDIHTAPLTDCSICHR